MASLSKDEVESSALPLHSGWTRDGDEIDEEFRFDDFSRRWRSSTRWRMRRRRRTTIPTSTISYNRVKMTLSTHSEGGVTEKDFAHGGADRCRGADEATAREPHATSECRDEEADAAGRRGCAVNLTWLVAGRRARSSCCRACRRSRG